MSFNASVADIIKDEYRFIQSKLGNFISKGKRSAIVARGAHVCECLRDF